MKNKTYKYRTYKEITTTETPYLNIFTGQRIFIDPEVVPPKNLFYVEDLNPYQRSISIVMDARNRKTHRRDREKIAANIYHFLKARMEMEKRSDEYYFNYNDYAYPVWFEEILEVFHYDRLQNNR